MSRLFIELYLDEDVDVLVADLVRARGFKAVTTQEVGRKKKADDDQLAFAASQQLTLVTHNRVDFEELAQQYFFDLENRAENGGGTSDKAFFVIAPDGLCYGPGER